MSNQIAEIIGPVSVCIVIGWIIRLSLAHRRWIRAAAIYSELQSKLVEKLSSASELLEYLKAEPGHLFLDSATIDRGSPYARILTSVQTGAVLTALGAGLYLIRGEVLETADLLILAVLALALGIGFLVSAVISYSLSRSWGLLNRVADASDPLPGSER